MNYLTIKLDRKKVDFLIDDLAQIFTHQEVVQCKIAVNKVVKMGKVIPKALIIAQTEKYAVSKFDSSESDLLKFVFDNTGPAVMIALMQLSTALVTELINCILLTG